MKLNNLLSYNVLYIYILYMFIVTTGIHNINTAYHQKGFYSECCLKFKITFPVPVAADCIKLQFVSQQLFIYFWVFRSLCPKYLWWSWVTPMQRRRVWLWLQAPVWTAASAAKITPSLDTSLCTTSTATCQLKLKLCIFYLKTNTQQTYENNLTFFVLLLHLTVDSVSSILPCTSGGPCLWQNRRGISSHFRSMSPSRRHRHQLWSLSEIS